MNFRELNDKNFLLFAIQNFDNPQAVSKDDFDRDLNHFKYIKRLLRKYLKSGELKTHLLLNHFIIIYNVFGEAATPMLFYKLDKEMWSLVKTFVLFLNRLPEYPKTDVHYIQVDIDCLAELQKIYNGQAKD